MLLILFLVVFSSVEEEDTDRQEDEEEEVTSVSLFSYPESGDYRVGDSFDLDIYLDTNGEDVVVVSAFLDYNSAVFEAVSVDVDGSVFEMTMESVIDNEEGSVRVVQGMPNPGVNTGEGLVATVEFRALADTGTSSEYITFKFDPGSDSSSDVLVNDGRGTDILDEVRSAEIVVTE